MKAALTGFEKPAPPLRILLTGGAGFIGSCLAHLIIKTLPQAQLTILDALTYAGNLENLSPVLSSPQCRFVKGDICDSARVIDLMAETDVCINAAAQTHVDRSIEGPEIFVRTNVLGTQVLLEAARQQKIQQFIQISTDEVYGSLALDPVEKAFVESDRLLPSSPYSASKAASDLLTLSYFKTYGLPVCVTRCSNNYGPRQYPEKLIPLFILNALAGKKLPVYGDGLNVRDWIHVEDHSRAVLSLLTDGKPGEVYNIGADHELNNLAMTREILKQTGQNDALITFVQDRLGHDRRYAINSQKIRRETGWVPTQDFEDGLAETIRWYRRLRS